MACMEGSGTKPKSGHSGKLSSEENIDLLQELFPDRDVNILSSYLLKYPGKHIEGLIEIILGNDSQVKCEVCWEEYFLENTVSCVNSHFFCRDCARKGMGIQKSEGNEDYRCLLPECPEGFDLGLLQSLINPKWFSKYVQNICMNEVKKCGSLVLESCPECNFAVNIEDPSVKVIECKYDYCKVMSCRKCRKRAHPYGVVCQNEEKEKVRLEVEEELSESVIRKCYRCEKYFQKYEGCNRIECHCGAQMCYICRSPVIPSQDHFYNCQEQPEPGKCPLQSNSEDLHSMERAIAGKKVVSSIDPLNRYGSIVDSLFSVNK
ncbi:RNF216 [Lepeophtheirus salmonis]|uniref:RNF216 n=1 Tax=Lepeophtheirus salmonis TaxID=72036 RepID=A0A7R8D3U9_LEPSM|nr:RNF216 [Lepeophtheirus salmonis]CAF3020358.1 RNF216 [Lepeophtheirus salmonis]